FAIDPRTIWIDDVTNSHHRSHRQRALVYAAVHTRVRMTVDDSGRYVFAARVNDPRVRIASLYVSATLRNLAVANQDRAVVDRSVRGSHDCRVLDQDFRGRRRGGLG